MNMVWDRARAMRLSLESYLNSRDALELGCLKSPYSRNCTFLLSASRFPSRPDSSSNKHARWLHASLTF
jgi:hypothetical protein